MSLLDSPPFAKLAVLGGGVAVVAIAALAGNTMGMLFGMGLAAGAVFQTVVNSGLEDVRHDRERARELLRRALAERQTPPPEPPPPS